MSDVPADDDDFGPRRPDPRASSPIVRWGCGFLVAVLSVVTCVFYRAINPTDWVVVSFDGQFAPTTDQCALIALVGSRPVVMDQYASKIVPVELPTVYGGELHGSDIGEGVLVYPAAQSDFRWVDAPRYGLLTHRQDKSYRVLWLNPDEVGLAGGLARFFGKGHATIRIPPEARAEVPDDVWLRTLEITK